MVPAMPDNVAVAVVPTVFVAIFGVDVSIFAAVAFAAAVTVTVVFVVIVTVDVICGGALRSKLSEELSCVRSSNATRDPPLPADELVAAEALFRFIALLTTFLVGVAATFLAEALPFSLPAPILGFVDIKLPVVDRRTRFVGEAIVAMISTSDDDDDPTTMGEDELPTAALVGVAAAVSDDGAGRFFLFAM